ncbi:hypothetical protein GM31_23640 [Trabulsiella odontotermitis]|uniref:Fimbrial-type adhesion domain-containing protein n=2 Tax=Trabulsiella odontotermitis TaxID=379893 RepID=A0A0L0GV91_9ENTR|nr:hypothetical protein GM31_23640 [Trabulsiella odontotermitis]
MAVRKGPTGDFYLNGKEESYPLVNGAVDIPLYQLYQRAESEKVEAGSIDLSIAYTFAYN